MASSQVSALNNTIHSTPSSTPMFSKPITGTPSTITAAPARTVSEVNIKGSSAESPEIIIKSPIYTTSDLASKDQHRRIPMSGTSPIVSKEYSSSEVLRLSVMQRSENSVISMITFPTCSYITSITAESPDISDIGIMNCIAAPYGAATGFGINQDIKFPPGDYSLICTCRSKEEADRVTTINVGVTFGPISNLMMSQVIFGLYRSLGFEPSHVMKYKSTPIPFYRKIRSEVNKVTEVLSSKIDTVSEKVNHVTDLTDKLDKFNDKLSQITDLSDILSQVGDMSEKLDKFTDLSQLANIDDKLTDFMEQTKSISDKYNNNVTNLVEQMSIQTTSMSELRAKVTSMDKLHDKMDSIGNKINKINEVHSKIDTILTRLNKIGDSDIYLKFEEVGDKVSDLHGKIEEISSQVGKIEEISSQVGKIEEMSSQVGKIEEMSGQVGKIEEMIDKMSKVTDLYQKLEEITVQVGKIEEMSSQVGKIEEIGDCIKQVNDKISKHPQIEEINTNVIKIQDTINKIEEINDKVGKIKELNENINVQGANLPKLCEDIIEKQIMEHHHKVTDRLKNITDTNRDIIDKVEKMSVNVGKFPQQMYSVADRITHDVRKILELSAAIHELMKMINELGVDRHTKLVKQVREVPDSVCDVVQQTIEDMFKEIVKPLQSIEYSKAEKGNAETIITVENLEHALKERHTLHEQLQRAEDYIDYLHDKFKLSMH